MITKFNVKSDRTHDITLQPGTTVEQLRTFLDASGYDVREANIKVWRNNSVLVGAVGGYRLGTGDAVEFTTKESDFPATRMAVKAATVQEKKAGNEYEGTIRDGKVTVRKCEDGICIHIQL